MEEVPGFFNGVGVPLLENDELTDRSKLVRVAGEDPSDGGVGERRSSFLVENISLTGVKLRLTGTLASERRRGAMNGVISTLRVSVCCIRISSYSVEVA